MSIIFGYINLNGAPVERETLETMQHTMDFWNPDGQGIWLEGSCGFGNLLLYNTPEALYEKLPMTDTSGNLILTAGARIDNRDDLFRIFDIPLGQRLMMPDSKLMLMAYERWGEACADHLVGDWAMAIWDKKLQKLFLARDHHGITAMYYYKGNDFFVFSSSLKGILCLGQVPKKINEFKIAQLLVNWNEGGPETCYLDIMRLPPAHTLTLATPTLPSTLTPNRYWFLEHTPEVRLKSDQEYVDMFLDLYTEAVRCRLRSYRPVGATLSSGLDSGSVCVLAARELAKEGKRLQAYTAVPLYDITGLVPKNRIGDEGPLAQALADKVGNIDITFCKAENISPLEGIEWMLEIIEEPNFAVGNAYWIIDILSKSNNSGIGTFLVGQNGNGTVSWPIESLLSKNYNTIKRRLIEYRYKFKFLSGYWKNEFLISEDLLFKYKIKKQIKNARLRPYFLSELNLHEIRMQIIRPGKTLNGDLWYKNGIFFKMEVRDPTVDVQLMKFLVGLPKDSKFCNNRKLFNLNFNDFIPEDIINGEKRGVQSVDLNQRINNEIFKLREKLLEDNFSNSILKKYISYDKMNKNILMKDNSKAINRSELLKTYLLKIYLLKIFVTAYIVNISK